MHRERIYREPKKIHNGSPFGMIGLSVRYFHFASFRFLLQVYSVFYLTPFLISCLFES